MATHAYKLPLRWDGRIERLEGGDDERSATLVRANEATEEGQVPAVQGCDHSSPRQLSSDRSREGNEQLDHLGQVPSGQVGLPGGRETCGSALAGVA